MTCVDTHEIRILSVNVRNGSITIHMEGYRDSSGFLEKRSRWLTKLGYAEALDKDVEDMRACRS